VQVKSEPGIYPGASDWYQTLTGGYGNERRCPAWRALRDDP
jgi:hypothetical protein